MKILLLNFSHLKFDVSTPDTLPLGGTESSLCYLARNLVGAGHEVTLMTHGGPGEVMGVKHFDIADLIDWDVSAYDVCISVNVATAARWVKQKNPDIKSIVWFHMMPDQPALANTAQSLAHIDLAVYVSAAQQQAMEMYYGIAPKSVVIGHAISPCFENIFGNSGEILAAKECRGIYTSTPYRGLTYLLDAAAQIDTPIDVYSSMKVYQGDDSEYKALYDRALDTKNINYAGSVGQAELVAALKKSAFFTYPCIFRETFCLSALEAMACGAKVISTKLGALPETTMGHADLIEVDYANGKNFVRGFTDQLKWNIAMFRKKPQEWAVKMWSQVHEVNERCTWRTKIKEWGGILCHED